MECFQEEQTQVEEDERQDCNVRLNNVTSEEDRE